MRAGVGGGGFDPTTYISAREGVRMREAKKLILLELIHFLLKFWTHLRKNGAQNCVTSLQNVTQNGEMGCKM